jgi:hypothetical protein
MKPPALGRMRVDYTVARAAWWPSRGHDQLVARPAPLAEVDPYFFLPSARRIVLSPTLNLLSS